MIVMLKSSDTLVWLFYLQLSRLGYVGEGWISEEVLLLDSAGESMPGFWPEEACTGVHYCCSSADLSPGISLLLSLPAIARCPPLHIFLQ